ncbi:MAG: hypothetical protein ACYS8K_10740, partial [Planctomycetota bacterium]
MDAFESEWRRRRRWIWGCTGGCLGFMVVVAAAIFLAFRFLGRPVPVVPPETFVHPETEALLVARVEHDDPLLVGL